ncbi:MAG: hypothetical protein JWM21_1820 [Acidobacteria bacterium]|nr:hypothetical protein [Acidobacteriota bacterium]
MRTLVNAICIMLLALVCTQAQINKPGVNALSSAGPAGEVSGLSLSALTVTQISLRKPDGLILSEGNLYFTTHDAAGAAVWRTSQNSIPGQETVLYWEQGAVFGDIVFANVDGNFFGYFFARKSGVTTIRRVPLTGGTATVLARVNVDLENSHRNLVADNVSLFWQDDQAVRKMPIRGGAISVLDRTRPNTPTAGIELQLGRIVYASVDDIRFVPKIGAITDPSVRTIAKASSPVTALETVSNGVYWGERSGAVRLRVGSTTTTLQQPTGLTPTSISTNGSTAGGTVVWTQCGSQSCAMRFEFPVQSGSSEPVGVGALGATMKSAGHVFWGDAGGVHRVF